ncbi:NRAMP family divalent metal transporter [Pontiella agarivorans]|uniref:Divalent metal cation transporter n=1 Tax=Pontiella agarivorans TaxID=3038953 RepID=A0ABU5MTU9_9BACT|nr:divalent metal cation transporter [Pontiella agarivorans]MDZ8117644.1 divalent metal cation transporter [Pontiella agarivorans]
MSDEQKSSGLPMASKWDPEKIREEEQFLQDLNAKPFGQKIKGYFKLTGPAWMQSAMTLGAGSAAASVVAGAFFGYQLLWVQPIAMFLGIFMMAALSNITLTKGERGYEVVKRELHPSIAFFWALATVVSTVIWHFGQYALLGGAFWDIANVAGIENAGDSKTIETVVRFAGGFLILGINIALTWNYGGKSKGIKIYEGFLSWTIRAVMAAFLIVVVVQAVKMEVDWGGVFKGFFAFSVPGEGSITTILGAIGAAVGINMTFLYPYSILAKGWGKHHKGLARFDLVMSLFVPYIILTSLIIIGMASTVHGNLGEGVTQANFKPIDAAQALASVLGSGVGRIVFDLGFAGMACGAISAHMVCCGFTVCEMFGLEYTTKRYRMFTLVPAIGILGVMIQSPIWLPVIASALAFTMLPIAYVSFFILNNKRSYLGDAVGKGWKRIAVNTVLLIAVILSLIGAGIKIKGGVIDKIAAMTNREAAK